MNKTALKYVAELAKHCLLIMEQTGKEHCHWTGKDLKLAGYSDHNHIKENEVYPVPYPVFREVNHKGRLKRAYKKKGRQGLVSYLAPFIQAKDRIRVEVFIMKNIP